jgi:hypothetical protein
MSMPRGPTRREWRREDGGWRCEGARARENPKPGARKCADARISAPESGFWKIRGEAAHSWSGIIFTTWDVRLLTSGGYDRIAGSFAFLRHLTPFYAFWWAEAGREYWVRRRGFILCAEACRKGFDVAAGPALPGFLRGGSFRQRAFGAQGSRTAYLGQNVPLNIAWYRFVPLCTAWRWAGRKRIPPGIATPLVGISADTSRKNALYEQSLTQTSIDFKA